MVSETPARPPGVSGVSPGAVGADEVFRIIRERLADILEIEESRITLEASFAEDLSADSLALIELVEAIEQELEDRAEGFRIEDEDLADLRTVRDAVDYVVERVG
jgi:acyl carrier protein